MTFPIIVFDIEGLTPNRPCVVPPPCGAVRTVIVVVPSWDAFASVLMIRPSPGFRLSAATGTHRGDRLYQQDQVEVIAHPRVGGCLLAIVADGMGGKSGGRKAADQVVLTAQQLFERFVPGEESATELLAQMVSEAHLMIKLTAISAEEEPHSTLAAFMISANRRCHWIHSGDSRIYHYRGPNMIKRTLDHSFVQRLVDEGQISEAEAAVHPQSNLLTGCLGTVQEPVASVDTIEALEIGDTLMCADGKVVFGATVELEDEESGTQVKYQIVGVDEADLKLGLINIGSPIARALIGKMQGDTAEVQAPGGIKHYEIIAVSYV